MKILVTGAGGFMGRVVTLHLLHKGHEVTALVRKSESISFDHPSVHWCVGDVKSQEALSLYTKNIEAVVHLAALKADEKDSYEVNVLGAENLVRACAENKISRVINISTISTKLKEKGLYAKTKDEADKVFARSQVPVITLRPSIVYGDAYNGIFGTLIKFTKLPFVPVFGTGDFTSRPIHVEDFAHAIENVVRQPLEKSCVYDIGGREEISFNNMVQLISIKMYGRKARLIHIPVFVGLLAARIFKYIFKKPPLTESNVMAMYQSAPVSPEAFLKQYEIKPRTLQEGIGDIKKQKEKVSTEAYVLMKYISKKMIPSDYYVELYKRGVARSNLNSHTLDYFFIKRAIFIGALDAITKFVKPEGPLQKKLLIASTIIECSPLSSNWLLPKEHSILGFLWEMVVQGLKFFGKLFTGLLLLCVPGLIKKNA